MDAGREYGRYEVPSAPITKPEDASRETIAAARARMVRAGDIALVSPTIAALLDDGDEWDPIGPSGEYTFLYRE
jgi:hypothetical protein